MKKFLITGLTLLILIIFSIEPVSANSNQVIVTIPAFKVTLNGEIMDNEYNKYPLLVYKDITYFPMTYYGSRFLGLKANWYEKRSVLFVGVCPESEKENQLKIIRNSNKNGSRYNAVIADYDLALNTLDIKSFINNSSEKYPILNFRGISYFPLTWKYAVDEFGWDYSYSNQDGLVINSGNAFRPVIYDKVLGFTLPYMQKADYYYGDNVYVVFPYSTYKPINSLVIRRRGENEKEYNLEEQLYKTKYSIEYLNVEKNENGAFVKTKPYVEKNIIYITCKGYDSSVDNCPGLEVEIGIDLDKGIIVSESLK